MFNSFAARCFLFCGIVLWQCAAALPQQFNVTAPFNQTSNSFFEQSGIGFNVTGPNFFFQQSSFGQALPQFGGFNPSAGATWGYGWSGGGWNANMNFAFGQGARSSMVSTTPSVTLSNGMPGGVFAGEWTPFVMGYVPVVNDGFPVFSSPALSGGTTSALQERIARLNAEPPASNSTQSPMQVQTGGGGGASAPALPVNPAHDPLQQQLSRAIAADAGLPSVADIECLRRNSEQSATQAREAEINDFEARGDAALQAGKPGVARIYYRQAASRAAGQRQRAIEQKIASLPSNSTGKVQK